MKSINSCRKVEVKSWMEKKNIHRKKRTPQNLKKTRECQSWSADKSGSASEIQSALIIPSQLRIKMRGLQNLPDIKGKYALLRKTQMRFESFLKVVTHSILNVVILCFCCICLTAMEIQVSGDILLFSPLFCRKVMWIKVDVICDLRPLLSFAALPLFYLFMLLYCDEQNELLASLISRDESARDATLPHSGEKKKKRKHKRNAALNVLPDV